MILVRHGESLANAIRAETGENAAIRDPGLTDNGRRQVAATADALSGHRSGGVGPSLIWSSPLTRALETSAVLADRLDLPVAVSPLLAERCAWHSDIGTETSRLRAAWPAFRFEPMDECWWPQQEEAVAALEQRSDRFRAEAHGAGEWQRMIVVTHWGFIRSLTGAEVINGAWLRVVLGAGAEVVSVDYP